MTWTDTHAHLWDDRLVGQLPAVLARARAAGVPRVLCIGIDLATSRQSVELAAANEGVYAVVGIQPNHVAEAAAGDFEAVVELLNEPKVVAIGETGLDRYWKDRTPFPAQEESFRAHLRLCAARRLPVVIHNRDAGADTVRVLREHARDTGGGVPGVMHSFADDVATLEASLELGLHVSFAGMLTYPSAADLREAARRVPLERLLVETDCPYLAPVPKRGKTNEPAFVAHTGAVLAAAVGVTPAELAAATTANAARLFGLG